MSESTLQKFVAKRTNPAPGAWIAANRLYDEYLDFCDELGEEPINLIQFEDALSPTYSIVTLQYGRFYSGLLVTKLGGTDL